MNTSAKKQIIPELLAAVLWGILTLWTDRLFFRYDWRTTAFFVYKALFVLLAFLLVHGIVTLVKKLRAKDRFVWRWLQWTLPYLAVNLIVLLIVWPGCWGNDDLNVLSLARTLQMDAWQHFLTSSAFILSLMFVPIPGGDSAYPESAHQCGGRLLCSYGPRPYRETAGSTGEAGVVCHRLPAVPAAAGADAQPESIPDDMVMLV